MRFASPLLEARLIRRYQRFLADVRFPNGSLATAHTPNTGAMLGCVQPEARVWLRRVDSATRKYPLAWELVEAEPGVLVGINTGLANLVVKEAIETGLVTELQGFESIRTEARYGKENSRIDPLLEKSAGARCYVEVKNVTLVDAGRALFPDAVTTRGAKHLRELAEMVRQGHRAVIFYCVQRRDAASMGPADRIDPAYGLALRQAMAAGVEALAYQAEVTVDGIALARPLPVICPPLPDYGSGFQPRFSGPVAVGNRSTPADFRFLFVLPGEWRRRESTGGGGGLTRPSRWSSTGRTCRQSAP